MWWSRPHIHASCFQSVWPCHHLGAPPLTRGAQNKPLFYIEPCSMIWSIFQSVQQDSCIILKNTFGSNSALSIRLIAALPKYSSLQFKRLLEASEGCFLFSPCNPPPLQPLATGSDFRWRCGQVCLRCSEQTLGGKPPHLSVRGAPIGP